MLEIKPIVANYNDKKIVIIVSEFNTIISEKLLSGTINTLNRNDVNSENITVIWVPGAYEIPGIALKVGKTEKYDGIITLGAVIKGETAHYDLVINAVSSGIANVSLQIKTPITFGVVTTNTLEQAEQRAGGKAGNKGSEVTNALLDLISINEQLSGLV